MKKPIVAILELHYHVEVLQVLFDVLDHEQFHFQLFVAKSVAEKTIIPKEIETFIVQKSITEYAAELEKSDILFFSTLADYFDELLPFIQSKKTIVRIHNVNTWFGKQGMAKPQSNYEAWKFVSHLVRKEWFGGLSKKRQQAIEHIDQFVFPVAFMKEHALRLRPELSEKCSFSPIPLVYQKERQPQPEKEVNHVVIPGRVDKRRKDYEFAYEFFKNLNNHIFKLTLLGKPEGDYGKRMLKQFNALHDGEQAHIESFTEYIPKEKFDEVMNDADVLFLPLVQETSFTMYREVYGKTKISGAVNDAIHQNIPFIIPAFYPVDKEFEKLCHNYSTAQNAKHLVAVFLQEEINPPKIMFTRTMLKEQYNQLFASAKN